MSAALRQTRAELRRLGVAGLASCAGDLRLLGAAEALKKSRAAVLRRLGEGLAALTDAPDGAAPGLFLRQCVLTHAVERARASAAPEGGLAALTGRAAPAPERASSRRVGELRRALRRRGKGRDGALRDAQAELTDLRLQVLLPAALDEAGIAEVVQGALAGQLARAPGLVADIEASLSGRAVGDARRLALVHQAAPARGWALARKLLDTRPKAALRAQIYDCLADDPEALLLLLAGTKRGPFDARAAALAALARREEPAAREGLLGALAEPGPAPSLLFQRALPRFSAPELICALQERLRAEMRRAPEESARVEWAKMLAMTSLLGRRWVIHRCPSAATLALLCQACEEGWAPYAASRVAAWCAPLEVLERLLRRGRPRRWSREDGFEVQKRSLDLILVAAGRLSPERFYALLSDGWLEDRLLQDAMRAWQFALAREPEEGWLATQAPGYNARPAPGAREEILPLRWDPRWLEAAMEAGRVELVTSLAKPGDAAAGAWLAGHFEAGPDGEHERLRALSTPEAVQAIGCLKRIGAPERGRSALALLWRLFDRGRLMKAQFEAPAIRTLLGYLEAEDIEALQSWLTDAGAPLHRRWQRALVAARVAELAT